MKKQLTQHELEHYFAKDMTSPIFCMLAETYYNNYDYKKAEKVCKIGLSNNPNSIIGKYILAKTLLINKKIIKAEKILKEIVIKDENNIKALLILIEVEQTLKRSKTVINSYISKAYKTNPENKKIQNLFKSIKNNSKKNQGIATKQYKTQKRKTKTSINQKMATKTMYTLMKNQNRLQIAKSVLEILNKDLKNKNFVKKEMKIIQQLINKK